MIFRRKKKNQKKTIKIILILFFLVLLGIFFTFITDFSSGRQPVWGVTFSSSYAKDLQLDWKKTYLAILDDLQVSHIRLSAYWDEIEPQKDKYAFTDLDWQINQADQRNVKMILAIGRRLPRWPECHDPAWVKHLTGSQANEEILELLEILVNRYKDNSNIITWQVENEPLFSWFGFCPPPDKAFLKQEVNLVKSLDPSRPVMITDSGELSSWQDAGGIGDILGTTLYRIVWNKKMGFWDYWFVPPAFYRYKADITKMLNKNLKQIVVMELQAEPWTQDKHMVELTKKEREQSFNLKRFKNNIEYSRKTGFPQVYLWGVEYWYWLDQQGEPEIWQEAKKLW